MVRLPDPPCFPSCDACCISFHTKSATCKHTMTNDRSLSDDTPCMRLDAPNRGFDRGRYTVLRNRPDVMALLSSVLEAKRDNQFERRLLEAGFVDDVLTILNWLEDRGGEGKRYFVLRYDCRDGEPADPVARRALAHYADLTKDVNATFADELQGELIRTEPRVMADRDNEPTERTHTDALQAVDAAAELIEGQEHDREAALCRDIATVINRHSRENHSDTPDFVLARYLMSCLRAFELATERRRQHAGEITAPVRTPVDDVIAGTKTSRLDASAPNPAPAPQRAVPPVDPAALPQPKKKP